MADKLFFSEVERQANEARARYMAARGAHGSKDSVKIIEVAANPGSDLGAGKNNSGGK